jgi:hypothetical protein
MTTDCKHNYQEYRPYADRDCPDCRSEAGLVGCDKKGCQAKSKPETPEEYKVAYEHWRCHGYLCGCSHAC